MPMAVRSCAFGRRIRRVISVSSPQCRIRRRTLKFQRPQMPKAIAYSDQPVAIEPGLSLDVLPIANMVAKLALLELLADRDSSLNILKRDFEAPWYLWLNRPEPGTAIRELARP